ncbi:MAG: TIGR01777 family oxidoreductase [Holophaga sp.]|nr:TIGR01777 family oxidoreductase [Holophaga sp.]
MADAELRRVVVAGGTGLVGRRLVAALVAAGTQVTVLSRTPGAMARSWEDLPGALEGADAVINLCGAGIAERRWSPERKRLLADSRIGPTERLARGMAAAGCGVLVNASAVGFYGSRDEQPVDERQGPGGDFLAQLCARWEAAATGARVVRLRLGVVLARDGGALPRMALPVRLFQGTRLGHGRQGLSWIHLDDLVRMIIEAAGNPAWRGPVNATAPVPVSNADFTRILARRLHRPLLPVPAWLTGAAVRALLGEMGVALLLEGAYVLPGAAQRLGFGFRFPRLEEALADLL